MAFQFDGENRLITLTAGTTLVSVRDLWSRWLDWYLTSDNSKFPQAMANLGGDPIDTGSGIYIPIYVFLINDWRIRPQESNHTLVIQDGILLVDGGGDPFLGTLGNYMVRVNYQQPVQAIAAFVPSPVSPSQVWSHPDRQLSVDGVTAIKSGLATTSDVEKVEGKVDDAQVFILSR